MTELEYVNCILCGKDNTKVLMEGYNTNLVKCRTCGLVYYNPRKKLNEFLQEIQKTYNSFCWDYEKINFSKRKIFLHHIKKILEKIRSKNLNKRLLDIGCSDGFFLEIAKSFGFDIYGVEISNKVISYAQERRPMIANCILNTTLKDANFTNQYFDVITLWDVLDELYSPDEELKEIRRILKPAGIIVLRIRNAKIHLWIYKLRRILSKFISSPHVFHSYGFTHKTIKKMLIKHGFKKIKVFNSPLTLSDPYLQSKVGRLLFYLKLIYYYISQILYFITFGKVLISTSLIVYAEK